jgi:hypothetical protein
LGIFRKILKPETPRLTKQTAVDASRQLALADQHQGSRIKDQGSRIKESFANLLFLVDCHRNLEFTLPTTRFVILRSHSHPLLHFA